MSFDPFLYGKDQTERVTSVDVSNNGDVVIYTEDGDIPRLDKFKFWGLFPNQSYDNRRVRLNGELYYKYGEKFNRFQDLRAECYQNDGFYVYNRQEQFLIKEGVTYYKGMEPRDVSVLSFDIEATTLTHNPNSKVLLIANTYRKGDYIERRLFAYDDFNSQKEMIYAWCNYVYEKDPSILLGHNVFGYDIPYLRFCLGGELPIGKGKAKSRTSKRPSQFRKDGSQSYDYYNVQVPGREIVDTFHLSIKYDTQRNYPSYGLKEIVRYEGLEKDNRQHYDAAQILANYQDEVEWSKIKDYAKDDADDSLALFDLMIPAYFYYAQSIPKTMQQIINSASGSQVNSFLVRSYIHDKHSLPKASDTYHYEGGISYGNPGIYEWVGKVDVASLYPSIIKQWKIYDKAKDPKAYFLKMVDLYTAERLKNKSLAKETGERRYKDLSDAQKIIINSAYGFMGAPGLVFNSPKCAEEVTKRGRRILNEGVDWAKQKGWEIVNVDTDSFSFAPGSKFTSDDMDFWLKDLNRICPESIVWENDGIYENFIVIKAKNYVMRNGKITIKGSALKATMKEPALQEFIRRIIYTLLEEGKDYGYLTSIYSDYVNDIRYIDSSSINQWSSKKTVTKAVLRPQRTNESRIKEAIERSQRKVQEGDKIRVFFETPEKLSLDSEFRGIYDKDKLYEKLFKTIKIFEPILDISKFPNYKLKRNKGLLEAI